MIGLSPFSAASWAAVLLDLLLGPLLSLLGLLVDLLGLLLELLLKALLNLLGWLTLAAIAGRACSCCCCCCCCCHAVLGIAALLHAMQKEKERGRQQAAGSRQQAGRQAGGQAGR